MVFTADNDMHPSHYQQSHTRKAAAAAAEAAVGECRKPSGVAVECFCMQ
jgi:hypothetical protein